jgi:hypothetical protein
MVNVYVKSPPVQPVVAKVPPDAHVDETGFPATKEVAIGVVLELPEHAVLAGDDCTVPRIAPVDALRSAPIVAPVDGPLPRPGSAQPEYVTAQTVPSAAPELTKMYWAFAVVYEWTKLSTTGDARSEVAIWVLSATLPGSVLNEAKFSWHDADAVRVPISVACPPETWTPSSLVAPEFR